MMRVLVADDEAIARRRVCRLLAALPEVEVVAECGDGRAVLEAVASQRIDVAILDIQMPHLDGLDAGALLGERRPYIIFVTAHREHAVAAFDLGATDYVLKPVGADRLRKALERAREAIGRASLAMGAEPPDEALRAKLPIHTSRGVVLLAPEEILCAVLDGALVSVVTSNGRWVTEQSLSDLERRLPEGQFRRVHRQALVNLGQLRRVIPDPNGTGRVELLDGTVLRISRQAVRRLRKELGI